MRGDEWWLCWASGAQGSKDYVYQVPTTHKRIFCEVFKLQEDRTHLSTVHLFYSRLETIESAAGGATMWECTWQSKREFLMFSYSYHFTWYYNRESIPVDRFWWRSYVSVIATWKVIRLHYQLKQRRHRPNPMLERMRLKWFAILIGHSDHFSDIVRNQITSGTVHWYDPVSQDDGIKMEHKDSR